MKLSVLRALLVMPRRSGRALAGLPPLLHDLLVLGLEDELVDLFVDQELGVPDLLDLDPAQHHPDDRLDVLVVDGDALEPVDGLDLLEEVFGQLLLAEDAEDVVRVDRPVHEGVAGPDALPVGDAQVGALGDEVFLLAAALVADGDLAVAADEAADLDESRRSRR